MIGRKSIIRSMSDERLQMLGEKGALFENKGRSELHESNRRKPPKRTAHDVDSPGAAPDRCD